MSSAMSSGWVRGRAPNEFPQNLPMSLQKALGHFPPVPSMKAVVAGESPPKCNPRQRNACGSGRNVRVTESCFFFQDKTRGLQRYSGVNGWASGRSRVSRSSWHLQHWNRGFCVARVWLGPHSSVKIKWGFFSAQKPRTSASERGKRGWRGPKCGFQ